MRKLGIGTRMVAITMLPVVFLFSSFVWYSWYSHRTQVAEELAERGRILAKALAETSEYNVISGNLSDLRLTINGLVQSDRSIHRIDVVDANQQPAISVASSTAADAEPRYYEAPIRKQLIWINLFSDNGAPHVSGSSDTKPPTLTTETVGWVRVTMSPSHMLDKQARRFRLELLLAQGIPAPSSRRSLPQYAANRCQGRQVGRRPRSWSVPVPVAMGREPSRFPSFARFAAVEELQLPLPARMASVSARPSAPALAALVAVQAVARSSAGKLQFLQQALASRTIPCSCC